jgi:hypothetical protein
MADEHLSRPTSATLSRTRSSVPENYRETGAVNTPLITILIRETIFPRTPEVTSRRVMALSHKTRE